MELPPLYSRHTLRYHVSSASNVAIYDQYDFIPNQLLMDFANTGYVLKPVFEWLSVPEDLAYAVVGTVGCQLEDHVSAIAFVLPSEWETMVTGADIGGIPINFVLRAKLRQVLLSARILVGMVRAPLRLLRRWPRRVRARRQIQRTRRSQLTSTM